MYFDVTSHVHGHFVWQATKSDMLSSKKELQVPVFKVGMHSAAHFNSWLNALTFVRLKSV